jgi:plastocyanin
MAYSQQHTDQEIFDEEVVRKGKVALEVLAGVGIFAAVLMSSIALVRSGGSTAMMRSSAKAPLSAVAFTAPGAAGAAGAAASATASAAVPVQTEDLKIVAEYKRGPEGALHDAFTKTNFTVKVGQPLRLRIDNTDSAPHSITSPQAGVNITIQPGIHTYTLLVHEAGHFTWDCILECDPWAMSHIGYMSGYITAT